MAFRLIRNFVSNFFNKPVSVIHPIIYSIWTDFLCFCHKILPCKSIFPFHIMSCVRFEWFFCMCKTYSRIFNFGYVTQFDRTIGYWAICIKCIQTNKVYLIETHSLHIVRCWVHTHYALIERFIGKSTDSAESTLNFNLNEYNMPNITSLPI